MQNTKILGYSDLINIQTISNNEKMVALNNIHPNIICAYKKFDMREYTGDLIYIRKSCAEKLYLAANNLQKKYPNYCLLVVYGYRHPGIQDRYFNKELEKLKEKSPDLPISILKEKTHLLVADPEVAGHPTGGAIDITILHNTGKELDMGSSIADFTDPEIIKTFSKKITSQQKINRLILHDTLTEVGFAPFYGEWWHFSYGDREWAVFYKKEYAIYEQVKFHT